MILILLGTWLAFHFGDHSVHPFTISIEQAEALVKQHVNDPAKQKQAVVILEQMKKIDQQRAKELTEALAGMQKIADDRAATTEQFMQVAEAEHAKVVAFQAKLIELRSRLKEQVSKSEWALVFPAPATKQ